MQLTKEHTILLALYAERRQRIQLQANQMKLDYDAATKQLQEDFDEANASAKEVEKAAGVEGLQFALVTKDGGEYPLGTLLDGQTQVPLTDDQIQALRAATKAE